MNTNEVERMKQIWKTLERRSNRGEKKQYTQLESKKKKVKGVEETKANLPEPTNVVDFQDENEDDYFPSDRRKGKFDDSLQEKLKAFDDEEEQPRALLSAKAEANLQEQLAPPKTLKQKLGKLKEAKDKETKSQKIEKLPKKDLSGVSSNWLKFLQKNKEDTAGKTELGAKDKKPEYKKRIFPFANNLNPPQDSYTGVTPVIALDCEMVKVEENESEVARITIVNYNNHVLFDQFIRPKRKITDYLTFVSGVTYGKIKNQPTIDHYKDQLLKILTGRKIVGHTLKSDFEALRELGLVVPEKDVRDISKCRHLNPEGRIMALKKMAERFLSLEVQVEKRAHNSIEDARAAMALYRKIEFKWEQELKSSSAPKSQSSTSTTKPKTKNGAQPEN
eukprot:CAMPEP_0176413778 /NCGR_PEP_ID=MMETSP0127-20121128/4889_1 /TAXON_ID=938130 /ORGANISM="Platyophrya macrostoma, Strain WH" /LENGTH=390 /DNA_ID=CAMNT_0017793599 /DNA_START=48 /DNA_END=1220 /DNA_ORIENTATION=+